MLAKYEETLQFLIGDSTDDTEIMSHLLGLFKRSMAKLASDDECRPRAAKPLLSDYLYLERILLEAHAGPQSTSIRPVSKRPLLRWHPGQMLQTEEISRLRLMESFASNDIELLCPNGLNPKMVIAVGVLCYFKHKGHNFKKIGVGKPWIYEQIMLSLGVFNLLKHVLFCCQDMSRCCSNSSTRPPTLSTQTSKHVLRGEAC